MPETARRSRLGDNLDPTLIRQVRGIAWVWAAIFVACAAVFQGIDVQLPNPAWFVFPGGRSTTVSLHAFVPWQLLLISWGALLVFLVMALVNRELTRRTRAWPMVVLMVLGVLVAAFFGTLVTGAILQLGEGTLGASAAFARLVGPAETMSALAAAAALVSLVAVPGVLAARRRQRPAV